MHAETMFNIKDIKIPRISIILQFRNTHFWKTIFCGHSHFVVGRMSRLKDHEVFVTVGQAVVEHPRQRSANTPQYRLLVRASIIVVHVVKLQWPKDDAAFQMVPFRHVPNSLQLVHLCEIFKRFGRMLFDKFWQYLTLLPSPHRGVWTRRCEFRTCRETIRRGGEDDSRRLEFTWMASICTAFVRCFS